MKGQVFYANDATSLATEHCYLLFGQFLSGITSMTVQYAIIWYLTAKTGSATILSIATLLGMLPTILLSPFCRALY